MNRLLYLFMFLGFSFNSCNTLTERIDGFFVHGIDVSHHQGEIDWLIVGQEGVQFVFVKATEGGDHVDSLYSKNWSSIEKVGVKKGAYHYYRPGIHPQTQADNFINTVTLISGDLALWLMLK